MYREAGMNIFDEAQLDDKYGGINIRGSRNG